MGDYDYSRWETGGSGAPGPPGKWTFRIMMLLLVVIPGIIWLGILLAAFISS